MLFVLRVDVKEANAPSRRIFAALGCEETAGGEGVREYRRRLAT